MTENLPRPVKPHDEAFARPITNPTGSPPLNVRAINGEMAISHPTNGEQYIQMDRSVEVRN